MFAREFFGNAHLHSEIIIYELYTNDVMFTGKVYGVPEKFKELKVSSIYPLAKESFQVVLHPKSKEDAMNRAAKSKYKK